MNTNQKWPRTSALLRRIAAMGPMPWSRITGVVSDQRVYSHTPGMTSSKVASGGDEKHYQRGYEDTWDEGSGPDQLVETPPQAVARAPLWHS